MLTLGLRLLAWLLRGCPPNWGAALARGAGRLAHRALGGRRRLVEAHLNEVWPGGAPIGSRAVFEHLGQTAWDFVQLPVHRQEGFRRVVGVDADALSRALALGRGVVAVTGHLGSWELALAAAASWQNVRTHVVVKSLGSLDPWVTQCRRAAGLEIIRADGDQTTVRRVVREVVRALKAGDVVVVVIDQHAPAGACVVPFFGRPAATITLPARLAIRRQVPIVWVESWRTDDGGHRVRFEAVPTAAGSVRALTADLNRRLESAIRRQPAQWLWTHRRWKVSLR